MEVKDITKPVLSIAEDTTFEEAIRTMVNKKTNSLLVTNETGILVGTLGMSDILDAIVPEYLDGDSITTHFSSTEMFIEAVTEAKHILVKEFMSPVTETVETTDSLLNIAAIAIAGHSTHIPVVDADGQPVGVISRRGVKHIIADALNIPDSE
jgi:CBS domain-containing protein